MKRQWQNTRNESKIIMVTRLIFKAHTMAQVDSVSVITTPLWLQPFYSPTHSLFGQKKITSHVNTTAICPFFQLKFATAHSNTIYLVPISVAVLSLSFSLFFFFFHFDVWLLNQAHWFHRYAQLLISLRLIVFQCSIWSTGQKKIWIVS